MSCKDCPYYGTKKIPYVGNRQAKIALIGEAPANEEIKKGLPFVGKSGQLLFSSLKKFCNLTRKDVAILNAVKCQIDNQNKKLLTLALKNCRPFLEKALHKIKPKLIVVFGSTAAKQILGKGDKITQRSGTFEWSDEFNCWVLISIHPSYVLRNGLNTLDDKFSLTKVGKMWSDVFNSINSFIKNGYEKPSLDLSGYREMKEKDIDYILKHKIVAFDYETNSLEPYSSKSKILSVAFSVKPKESFVIVLDKKEKINWIKRILTSNLIKIVANRPFEEIWTDIKLGFEIKQPVHDVLTMAHIVNEENCQPYSLEQVANRYANMLNIKEVAEGQRANLENASKDLLIRYNGVDSDATLRSYLTLKEILLKEKKLLNYYKNITYKAQTIYAKIEKEGLEIDIIEVKKLEAELKNIADELEEEALFMIPETIKEKYKENLTLSRSAIIVDYLFTHKDGMKFKPLEVTPKNRTPSTTEKHLKNFENKSTFVKYYLKWKKATKILNTYFKQIYESINPETSKIYPHTLFISTKTGRLSIKNPAIQTIPQRGEFSSYIKKVFKAPEGWLMFDRDLSQSELRIMGWVSNCKGILTALKNGIDLHRYSANMLLNIPIEEVTKEQRQAMKAVNFGFIYGASAKTFQQIAKNDYGIEFTIEEAEELRAKFFKAYPEIIDWHNKILAFGRKHGYVESPLGRRRHLPFINSDDFYMKSESERQAINFPIQSFSSDLNLIAQILLQKYIDENEIDFMKNLFLIHDALYGFVKEEYVKEAQKITKQIMEKETAKYIKKHFGVKIGYPIASEFSAGKDWDSLEEYDDKEVL